MRRMTVLRMGTTDQIGLLAMYLSVQDRGSTALQVSMATSIIASIRIMDTGALCPHVVRSRSIIFRRMRPVMAMATWSRRRAMPAAENTRCLDTVAVVGTASSAVVR